MRLSNLPDPVDFPVPLLTLAPDRPLRRSRVATISAEIRKDIEIAYGTLFRDRQDLGVCAWHIQPASTGTGVKARIFDYECSVAIAVLIALGFEPRAAAALVDMDFIAAFAPPGLTGNSKLEEREIGLLAGCSLGGVPYAICAATDVTCLEPHEIQAREGYCVARYRDGRLTEGPVAEVVRQQVRNLYLAAPVALVAEQTV